MKRATRRFYALMTAFLIVFTTAFGNASFSVEAIENAMETTVSEGDVQEKEVELRSKETVEE